MLRDRSSSRNHMQTQIASPGFTIVAKLSAGLIIVINSIPSLQRIYSSTRMTNTNRMYETSKPVCGN